MRATDGVGRTIRNYLKDETSVEHARLDERLGALITDDTKDYAAFLAIQYCARRGIECWLDRHCPPGPPPPQTGLIARDLADLGHQPPLATPDFATSDGAQALGVCWVLAGSALGNRTILSRMARLGARRPVAFLSDPEMGEYWRGLLPALQRPATESGTSAVLDGALATFAHFNAAAADHPLLEMA